MMNQHKPVAGKTSIKHARKDQALMASLGIKQQPLSTAKPTKVERLLGDTSTNKLNEDSFFQPETGKLTFKSYLKPDERTAVRKVASGVSEELGLKLLAPTPGSKLLIKHLTRDPEADQKKDITRDEQQKLEKERIRQNQMGAQKLISQAKLKGKIENSLSINMTPKLGRGLSSGGMISFDFSPKPKSSKEAAILALKGKTLTKNEPNHVMKRKRSSNDLESMNKKVARALDESNSDDKDKKASEEAVSGKKEVKTFRSFTGEIIDEKKMDELRNKKSINQRLVNDAELEEEDKYFNYHEKKEAMEEKMVNTKEIAAKIVTCKICNYSAYKQSDHCKSLHHLVKVVQAKKRFFECKKCKKRTYSFDKMPKKSCPNCQESSWVRVGMMRERKGPVLENEKLHVADAENFLVQENH